MSRPTRVSTYDKQQRHNSTALVEPTFANIEEVSVFGFWHTLNKTIARLNGHGVCIRFGFFGLGGGTMNATLLGSSATGSMTIIAFLCLSSAFSIRKADENEPRKQTPQNLTNKASTGACNSSFLLSIRQSSSPTCPKYTNHERVKPAH